MPEIYKRKIAMLSLGQFYPNLIDGASTAMYEIMRFITGQGDEGWIYNYIGDTPYEKYLFDFISSDENSEVFEKKENICRALMQGVYIYQQNLPCNNLSGLRGPKTIKLILAKLKESKIDYIFTIDNGFAPLFIADLLKIRGAHFFHSVINVEYFQKFPAFINILKRRTVFACSEYLKQVIKRYLGIDAIVWHSIFDFAKYVPLSMEEEKNKCIGFYTSGWQKGDEVVKELARRLPQYQFIIIGRKIRHSPDKIPANLKYLDVGGEMKMFYRRLKLLLVPSLIDEAFSRVILEAAINGVPVIANNMGGIPEALGDSGILIEVEPEVENHMGEMVNKYAQAICRMMSNDREYAIYSQKARLRAKQYERDQNAMNQNIYDKYICA